MFYKKIYQKFRNLIDKYIYLLISFPLGMADICKIYKMMSIFSVLGQTIQLFLFARKPEKPQLFFIKALEMYALEIFELWLK